MNTEKLEIINEMKRRFPGWINSDIQSVKFCRNEKLIFLNFFFNESSTAPIITNLDFIGDDEDLTKILFTPEKKITDNALQFVALDAYTISLCEEKLFSEEANKEIVLPK